MVVFVCVFIYVQTGMRPTKFVLNGYRGFSPRGKNGRCVELSSLFHLLLTLIMTGATPPLSIYAVHCTDFQEHYSHWIHFCEHLLRKIFYRPKHVENTDIGSFAPQVKFGIRSCDFHETHYSPIKMGVDILSRVSSQSANKCGKYEQKNFHAIK